MASSNFCSNLQAAYTFVQVMFKTDMDTPLRINLQLGNLCVQGVDLCSRDIRRNPQSTHIPSSQTNVLCNPFSPFESTEFHEIIQGLVINMIRRAFRVCESICRNLIIELVWIGNDPLRGVSPCRGGMKVLLAIDWFHGPLRRPYRNHEMSVDSMDFVNGHSIECSHEADGLTRGAVATYQTRSCFGAFRGLFDLLVMGQRFDAVN